MEFRAERGIQVHPSAIEEPTSRITTPAVVQAYSKAAGDFEEAVWRLIVFSYAYLNHRIVAAVLPSSGQTDVHI